MNSPQTSIWLGYDGREATAFAIAKYSIRRFDKHIPIYALVLDQLREDGLYYRPTDVVKSGGSRQLFDVISRAKISTEFSISRFLVPFLAREGWALFSDSDVIYRANPNMLFQTFARSDKAVMVVKHNYEQRAGTKMDGQVQTVYPRKNWSSVMLFNCDHPSNKKLTVEYVNTVHIGQLHELRWLEDDEIGELPQQWNYCVGHSPPTWAPGKTVPSLVHFTEGLPDMPGYEEQEYADEWRAMRPYAVGAL